MRWLFVEPQGFIPFGLNAWNHIIFNSNDIARKYPHAFLHIGTLEHIEKWNIGNNNAVTFSLSYID
jgi:hypothetical protein